MLAKQFTLTAFAGFIDAVRLAADDSDRSRQVHCTWEVLGSEPIVSSCGLPVQPWGEMNNPSRFDYIVVVGGLLHGGQKVVPGTNAFLRSAARAGIPLIGLCTGSFMLARAGLLNGYAVCVSWFHKQDFEREFPDLRVQSDHMFVIDRDRITSAGGTSVVHLAAHLIEKHCGRAQALKSLRIMIEEQPLPQSAWQPEEIVTKQAQDGVVRKAMLLIEQDLADSRSVAELAASMQVSERQLQRRFLDDVGISPSTYRLRLRLARARWMIGHTDLSMTEIGLACGFADSAYFSRAYRAHFGETPSERRRSARI